jgi:UDP-glucose 4-epimerase
MIEAFMRDFYKTNPNRWHFGVLRYFNPCGAHESGMIGEDPNGTPQNLMPFIAKVAGGKLPTLTIFGDDYSTRDGTAVRDYIHVVDLAKGHILALNKLAEKPQFFLYNLGSGTGTTVNEMVAAFEKACGFKLPTKMGARRPGDVPTLVADPAAASRDLGWEITLDVNRMCADLWRWQTQNPDGYNTQ